MRSNRQCKLSIYESELEIMAGNAAWFGEKETGGELYGFYDVGAIWQIDAGGSDKRESLASTGVGVRTNLAENFWGALELAFPLTRSPTVDRDDGDKSPRLFFSVIKRF